MPKPTQTSPPNNNILNNIRNINNNNTTNNKSWRESLSIRMKFNPRRLLLSHSTRVKSLNKFLNNNFTKKKKYPKKQKQKNKNEFSNECDAVVQF